MAAMWWENDDRWSDLSLDIMFLIVNQKHLSLSDIGRMATVCKSWNCIIRENNWFGLHVNANIGKTPFPWLMLAETLATRDGGKRGFFNPATGHVSEIYLPEAKGKRCCGSSHGWIVTMELDMEIKLLNPLTRAQLNIPSQLTFDEFLDGTSNKDLHFSSTKEEILKTFIRKAILTCDPSISEECMVVAFICPLVDYQLARAKPGDSAWTLIPALDFAEEVDDFIFYQGQLFGISLMGEFMVLDLCHKREWKVMSPALYSTCRRALPSSVFNYYLVEIAGTFVTVVRHKEYIYGSSGRSGPYKTMNVLVLEFRKAEWCQINDIGDCCLFLGSNQSICFSPVPRGFRPNCIYFTDDHFHFPLDCVDVLTDHDMLVYSMEYNTFSQFFEGVSLSPLSPPLWVTLNSN